MPEGDTLHRTALRLRAVLAGQPVVRVEAPRLIGPFPAPGTQVTRVEAVGKHLVIDFADGQRLRTHLGMPGSWHLYRTGERWRRSPTTVRALVEVPGWVAVCFNAPDVSFTRGEARPGSRGADPLGRLGPDLCRPGVDLDAAVDRMATIPEPDAPIAVVLLDQRVAAGIGNVYKSEVLWACRVDPFAPVSAVPVAVRRELLRTAARQLQANLTTTRRTTVAGPPGALAVYRRAGRGCLRCGTPIRMARQGIHARSTYWCPTCQATPTGEAAAGEMDDPGTARRP